LQCQAKALTHEGNINMSTIELLIAIPMIIVAWAFALFVVIGVAIMIKSLFE
jgi:hypothetical protein